MFETLRNKLCIADSLHVPTKGPPALYVEPVKRALQMALPTTAG